MTFGGQSRIEGLPGRIELFSGLEPAALSKLAAHGEVVHVPGGETLMREGDASDAPFVVASGRLQAFVDGGAGKTLVGEIGRGEVIGEMGNGSNSKPTLCFILMWRSSGCLPGSALTRSSRRVTATR